MDINSKIGERIRDLRKERSISQESLAHMAEIDRTYMTGVESGKRNVSVKVLDTLGQSGTMRVGQKQIIVSGNGSDLNDNKAYRAGQNVKLLLRQWF